MGAGIDALVDKVDDLQRRFTPAAFLVAVLKRFGDDRGSQYAALLSYYGFFSLLPILLVITTISAKVLEGDPERQQQIIKAITDHVPVTGDTVAANVHTLNTSGIALVIGLLATAYGALGAMNTAQDAFNTMWGVPRFQWPSLLVRMVRSAVVVLVIGLALGLAAVSGSLVAALDLPLAGRIVGLLVTAALNTCALLLSFELLVNTRIGLRTVLPGAITGGIGLVVLQYAGAIYLRLVLARLNAFYGVFATAMGLLIWISLQARVVLLAGEVNVVRSKSLYPRSLTGRRLSAADRTAMADAVARESLSEGLVVHAKVKRDRME